MSKATNQKKKRGLILVFMVIFAGVGSYLLINSFASVTPTKVGFETANDPKCTGGINTTGGNTSFAQDASKQYEGTYSAKASYTGGGANAYARCVVTTSWNTGDEVWYGGAFFLPAGFTQSMQNQVDLMRWDNYSLNNTSQDWGGIIIQNSDKKSRLKRFNAGSDYTDLSTPFNFPENRWVWVEVHQKFSPTNGQAVNEVYLDGTLQSSSTTANTYGREITRIRFGLVAIGAGSQTNPLSLWVDRATISASKVGPLSTTPPPLDTTPPETTITSSAIGSTTSTSANFTFTSNESGSTFECKLDSGSYSSCTSPKAYTGLSIGSHTFTVRATDSSNNTDTTPTTQTWTITTPPTTKPGDTNGDNVVNVIDLSTLLSKWNTSFPNADFNSDGTVGIVDLSVLLSNYGK